MSRHIVLSCVLLITAPSPAYAETPTSTAVMDERTTQLWEEGKAAAFDGRWEEAWVAFRQAYALNPTTNIRYNLALAALHTERYVLAARLMHETLATCGTPCPTKIQETTSTRLQEAEAHVGRIRVQTTGAVRILIDGESVDQKVAQNVWHVSPGKHDVVVESGRTSQTARVEVPAGQLSIVDFRLDDPAEERTEDTPESAAAGKPIHDHGPHSVKQTALLVGAGLTTVGLGLATVFTLKARSANSEASRLHRQIGNSEGDECSSTTTSACSALANAHDRREGAAAAAMISWVVTGALGLATAAGYFLWPDAQAHRAQRIVPIASGEFHGLMLQGAF